MKTTKQYWLMKSEPSEYSIHDLRRDKRAAWVGVRNYQARNFLRDAMRPGDTVLFYHSSCAEPSVAGLAQVVGTAYADPTQFDSTSPYFDPKATKQHPRWMVVDVKFVAAFETVVPLSVLRTVKALQTLIILRPGNRLSITPVTAAEFAVIRKLARL